MDRLRVLVDQMLDLFRRSRVEAEMKEELDFHLEMEIQSNLQAGMRPIRGPKESFRGLRMQRLAH